MNIGSTAYALVTETVLYPSGRIAVDAGEHVEVTRAASTFYILYQGVLIFTTTSTDFLFDHFIIDVPLEDIPWQTWS